jgi:hypothetical protein
MIMDFCKCILHFSTLVSIYDHKVHEMHIFSIKYCVDPIISINIQQHKTVIDSPFCLSIARPVST